MFFPVYNQYPQFHLLLPLRFRPKTIGERILDIQLKMLCEYGHVIEKLLTSVSLYVNYSKIFIGLNEIMPSNLHDPEGMIN